MPRVFDNIEKSLLPALRATLENADRSDFCVGYFNLRGWKTIDDIVERWNGGPGEQCRLLVGMVRPPHVELKEAMALAGDGQPQLDNETAARLRRKLAEDFREQLAVGAPTDADEAGLRRLAAQLRAGKLAVKLYLRHNLHAKLYLCHRTDPDSPVVGYLGSSNLTFSGLSYQGELNVDVLDSDATSKLVRWFEERWDDRWCIDITEDLIKVIETSWAREDAVPPFHIYLKMAYHLSQEARAGLAEFHIPKIFGGALFDFQVAAVKIAAHHLNKRGGVLVGDVVGLGKSMVATALAKIFEEDHQTEALIICPKNLVAMWEGYVHRYQLRAKVMPLSVVLTELPENTPRYRLVIIDESHNLRNKEGQRWRVIRDYIERNDSLTILLSATPYNKTYLDLSAQLALFLPEDTDIGIRPEKLLSEIGGEGEFVRRHQCGVRSLAAFEKSEFPDDWHDLMRLYMVRRTRGFIMQHYARQDERGKYLLFLDGRKSYFPKRIPQNLRFEIDDGNPADLYARMYSDPVVKVINDLALPRYGLGNYILPKFGTPPTAEQAKVIAGLARAGTRLMGFCRTNLFKRLESAGPAFLWSIERHILRNFVVLYALENGLEIPLGAQAADRLDTRQHDDDAEATPPDGNGAGGADEGMPRALRTEEEFRARAAEVYATYSGQLRKRFKWLPSAFFSKMLARDLAADARKLLEVLASCGEWRADADAKLDTLTALLNERHPADKVLIFTQFADTARYLRAQLTERGINSVADVTGASADPTALAVQFSPVSNERRDRVRPSDELRVLIATDVLSEGQNLQDAHIIVNYDLPWAIIRLIQRAGRVDRIGQQSDKILLYSFVPADGVERLIRLRARVKQRLLENAEVVGADEAFFDDDFDEARIRDLYTENSGVLEDDSDDEVDLASYAYQIWTNATAADPALVRKIEGLPDVIFSTKAHAPAAAAPRGILVYMRTGQGNDALTWLDEAGNAVSQSQLTILRAAACTADTPPLPRLERHHELTQRAVTHLLDEEKSLGGALGPRAGARHKLYLRLKQIESKLGSQGRLFEDEGYADRLRGVIEEIYRYPLYRESSDSLRRQLHAGLNDDDLLKLVFALRDDGRLCVVDEHEDERKAPRLICSMGLA